MYRQLKLLLKLKSEYGVFEGDPTGCLEPEDPGSKLRESDPNSYVEQKALSPLCNYMYPFIVQMRFILFNLDMYLYEAISKVFYLLFSKRLS